MASSEIDAQPELAVTMSYAIERARPEDVAALPPIEQAAGALFEGTDLLPGVESDTTGLDELDAAQRAGLLWVARDRTDGVVGFALVERLQAGPHLEEIDVHPAHGRRGIGRALVEAVCAWARGAGYATLTLTTFRDVPWNAPFYASAGFRILEPLELGPELREIVGEEASRGLDPKRRVVMRRDLA